MVILQQSVVQHLVKKGIGLYQRMPFEYGMRIKTINGSKLKFQKGHHSLYYSQINEILLDNDENQFISSGADKIVKIWMKKVNGLLWQCVQKLRDGINYINCLSLNPDCNYLVSDEFTMWEKGEDQLWKFKQDVGLPIEEGEKDSYDDCRQILDITVKFLNNDEFIAQFQKYCRIFRVSKNPQGTFQVTSELKFNLLEENLGYSLCFPMIYHKEQGYMIVKYSQDTTLILKQLKHGDFVIYQSLYGSFQSGYLLKNQQYLILTSDYQFEILKNM